MKIKDLIEALQDLQQCGEGGNRDVVFVDSNGEHYVINDVGYFPHGARYELTGYYPHGAR